LRAAGEVVIQQLSVEQAIDIEAAPRELRRIDGQWRVVERG
jgi:hypothetical protein